MPKSIPPFVLACSLFTTGLDAQVQIGQATPPANWSNFGWELAPAGDVDGDGNPDLLACARVQATPPLTGYGIGIRVLSGLDLHLLREQQLPPGAQWSYGHRPSLDGGHDLNADGVPDVILGVDIDLGLGRVDVLSGSDGALLQRTTAAQLALDDVVAVRFVGDVDGDGVFDYVAGFSHGLANFTGKLVWFSGATGAVLANVFADPSALYDYSAPMCTLGDLNGDGIEEIFLGWVGMNTNAGRAWIHDGRSGALLATLNGSVAWGAFGAAATGLGDLDGDGRGDFAISAPTLSPAGTNPVSHVHAYSGASFVELWEHAETIPSQLGVALANAGDLNGDGFADLLIGGGKLQPGVPGGGQAWILSGSDGSVLGNFSDSLNDSFGAASESLDLDGDGRRELIVAAPGYQSPSGGGRIDVYNTCPLPPQRTCTANQTPAGCHPTLDVQGSSSWSAPVRLTVSGTNLPGFQASLLLIGRTPAQLPFAGGSTLGIAAPIRRLLPQMTGGDPLHPECSGSTQRVLDQARLAALGYGPGDAFTLQLWIASPPTVRGALSDALRIVLCP